MRAWTIRAKKYRVNSASIRPALFRNTGAISWMVLICSNRFSMLGWPLCASRTWAGGEIAVIANQRIHTVALFVVIDGGLIDAPLQVVTTAGEASVLGVGSGTTPLLLFESVLGTRHAFDLQVSAYAVLLEDHLDFQVEARPTADPGSALGRSQTSSQAGGSVCKSLRKCLSSRRERGRTATKRPPAWSMKLRLS